VPVARPFAPVGDRAIADRLAQLVETGELRGDKGEAALLHTSGDGGFPRIVAAGVGNRDELDADALRTGAAVAAQALARVGGTIEWLLDNSLKLSLPEQAAALVEGTIIGGYSPGQWKTQEPEKRPRQIERIVIGHAETPELREVAERAALLAERTNRARDLANMPPNELNPHALGERAQELAAEHEHLKAEVL